MKINKVGIILKQDSSVPQQIGDEMVSWFKQRSIEALIDRIDEDMDILVILGGDGTLLHVAEQASRFKIPVVGVNLVHFPDAGIVFIARQFEVAKIAFPQTHIPADCRFTVQHFVNHFG